MSGRQEKMTHSGSRLVRSSPPLLCVVGCWPLCQPNAPPLHTQFIPALTADSPLVALQGLGRALLCLCVTVANRSCLYYSILYWGTVCYKCEQALSLAGDGSSHASNIAIEKQKWEINGRLAGMDWCPMLTPLSTQVAVTIWRGYAHVQYRGLLITVTHLGDIYLKQKKIFVVNTNVDGETSVQSICVLPACSSATGGGS